MSTAQPALTKKTVSFGVAWEGLYGYVQAVQVKDTIYLSGQLSHDREGNLVAPAALDSSGKPADFSTMEAQMQQTYVNIVDRKRAINPTPLQDGVYCHRGICGEQFHGSRASKSSTDSA